MTLLDLLNRPCPPLPWDQGDNIPWDDPQFSERMLQEHLCQEHDAASRRFTKIDQQVDWIHHRLLRERPTKILDLCCGPGFYTYRLAKFGHECVGIDYSPASIRYAAGQASQENLACRYLLEDIRRADYGAHYGLAMLIFGEFNIFRIEDARKILKKTLAALEGNGLLLLEGHTFDAVRDKGQEAATWDLVEKGLFSERPYLFLQESFWEPVGQTTTKRYLIMDAATTEVTSHAQSLQAYRHDQYRSLLNECGFRDPKFYPSLIGAEDESQRDFVAIVARKEVIK